MDAQKKDWMKKVLIRFVVKTGILFLSLAIIAAIGIYAGWTTKEVASGMSYVILAAIFFPLFNKQRMKQETQGQKEKNTEPLKVRLVSYIKEHKNSAIIIAIFLLLMIIGMSAD